MGGEVHPTSLTSELEGDKMVLKIAKPPRDKDSIAGLAWQCCTWMVSSPVVGLAGGQHALEAEHLASRSYLPSAAGQAAYYQVLFYFGKRKLPGAFNFCNLKTTCFLSPG